MQAPDIRVNKHSARERAVDLSIVVATCNRSESLRELIEALLRSEYGSELSWDIWIVDNNSTDETAALVAAYSRKEPRIHYVFEGAQGKSHALNRGVAQAAGNVIAFTDDDCVPDPHWVEKIVAAFAADSKLGLLGGRVELFNPEDHPTTTRNWPDRRTVSSATDVFSLIIGCNMAIRSNLLTAIGEFDPLNCPGSTKEAVFEDIDFIYRAFKKNMRIEYHPDVLLYHNHGRRSLSDLASLNRKYARGRGSFFAKHIVKGDRLVMKMAYWEVRSTLLSLAKNLLAGKPLDDDWKAIAFLVGGAVTRFTR